MAHGVGAESFGVSFRVTERRRRAQKTDHDDDFRLTAGSGRFVQLT